MSKKARQARSQKVGEPSRFCPRFHHAVELIGRRWSGAILNAMLPGAQCFNELLATVPGSREEQLAMRAIAPTLGDCLVAGAEARMNAAGTRSILALAAWRIVDDASRDGASK